MTNHMTFTRFTRMLIWTALIVPVTGSAGFAEDYLGMTHYYKSRAEVINAGVGHKTAHGAILTAQAGHIRAQGEYLKSRADAFVAIQNGRKVQQEIHGMKLDNTLKHADVFYKKRKLHAEYCATQPQRTRSPGEAKSAERKIIQARLTSHQLDCDGNISWPYALMDKRFAENRERLESFFAAQSRGVDLREYREVKIVTDEMKETLKSIIRDIPPTEYLAATKMLDGLATEARYAPQKRGDRIAGKQAPPPNSPG